MADVRLTDFAFQAFADVCVARCCKLGSLVLAFPGTCVARHVKFVFPRSVLQVSPA